MNERVDLGEVSYTHTIAGGELRVYVSEHVEPGTIYHGGPEASMHPLMRPNPLGGYHTKGGLAEAGWFELGHIADDGIQFKPH